MKTVFLIVALAACCLLSGCGTDGVVARSQLDLGGVSGAVDRSSDAVKRADVQAAQVQANGAKPNDPAVIQLRADLQSAALSNLQATQELAEVRTKDARHAADAEKLAQKNARLELVAGRWHNISLLCLLAGAAIFVGGAVFGELATKSGAGAAAGPVGAIGAFLLRFMPSAVVELFSGTVAVLMAAVLFKLVFSFWGIFG